MLAQSSPQYLGSASCGNVTPGAERHEKSVVFVESEIAVHHRGYPHAGESARRNAVPVFYITFKGGVGSAQGGEDLFFRIAPITVGEAVFPLRRAACDNIEVRVDRD